MSQTTTDPTDRDTAAVDGPADAAAARPWSAGHVIVVVVIALLVGALLNAQDLLATAERQPFGWRRDVAVALADPVAGLSAAVGLDRPRDLLDTAMGRGQRTRPVIDDAPDSGGPPAIAAPADDPVDADDPDAPRSPSATPTAGPSPPEPPGPDGPMGLDRGPVTAADPLELFIGGDSMVEIQFGMALEDLAGDTRMIETVAVDYDRGSGLTRPDFVDWPARLAEVSASSDPDVMVVYFGGNDAQPMKLDGVVYDVANARWQAEYRSRVADLMDQLAEAGHHVYWMGLPIPRGEEMVAKWTVLDAIYASEAAERDAITFIEMWDLFSGSDGAYAEYLTDQDGDDVDMRLDDGIHLTTAGAYRAARPTLARIADDFDIDDP